MNTRTSVHTPQSEPQGVHCRSIVKRYEPTTAAIDGLDLDVAAGTIQVLVGPSGCGKTTLLRCIAGLETVTSGSVHIGDRDVTRSEPGRRPVAMVFQDHGLYPSKTARENIDFPLRMAKVPAAERAERVAATADLLQITALLGRKPSELSGGQRQRVGIGRALVRNPPVLLMDEPLSSLDAQLRQEMRTELLELQRTVGMTIIYVTHDQTEALTLGDNIAVMRGGIIEQSGTPDEIYRHPRTTFVGGFVGTMNMFDALWDGFRLDLGVDACLAGETRSQAVQVGIRPADIELKAATDPAALTSDSALTIRGRIHLVEYLGDYRLCHVKTSSGTTVSIQTKEHAHVGESVVVQARRENMHIFDKAGVRIMEPAIAHAS